MPLDPKYNSVTITKETIFDGKIIVSHQATCYPREVGWGGGVRPYNGLYGEAPPERGTFFRLELYEGVGISLAEVEKG